MIDTIKDFVRISTIDGGELVISQKCIKGLDERVQGIQTKFGLIVSLTEQDIQHIEVSRDIYEGFRDEMLGKGE